MPVRKAWTYFSAWHGFVFLWCSISNSGRYWSVCLNSQYSLTFSIRTFCHIYNKRKQWTKICLFFFFLVDRYEKKTPKTQPLLNFHCASNTGFVLSQLNFPNMARGSIFNISFKIVVWNLIFKKFTYLEVLVLIYISLCWYDRWLGLKCHSFLRLNLDRDYVHSQDFYQSKIITKSGHPILTIQRRSPIFSIESP